jgi:hypothetical protein
MRRKLAEEALPAEMKKLQNPPSSLKGFDMNKALRNGVLK